MKSKARRESALEPLGDSPASLLLATSAARRRWGFSIYALTVFSGAFLLFSVQPLAGRLILPWFGGSAAVWNTCLAFFQVMLLGGYTYAHLLTSRLGVRSQVTLHTVLLIATTASAVFLFPPGSFWKPDPGTSPMVRILGILSATLGGPYLLIASTGPLIQRWFSWAFPGVPPYRLYALSNAGSLLALVGYPA